MELDLNAVRHWVDLLHGDSNGFLHVCSPGSWSGQVCADTEEAVNYVKLLELSQPQGIYLRATTIRRRLNPGERGKAADAACLPGLWGDIDIAGPGHRTDKPLPTDEHQATQLVAESGLPEPTLWVHSGGGLYPWWLLNQPMCLDEDPEQLEIATDLSRNWQQIMVASATRLGFHYGGEVGDLSRVLRIPGTINRKVKNGWMPCQLITDLGGVTYDFAELVESMMRNMSKLEAAKPVPVPRTRPTTPASTVQTGGTSPGDALEQLPWDHELLLADWQLHHTSGGISYWTRPGKSPRLGYSATTGFDTDRDRLYVFSSETDLPVNEPLNKFAVYAHLHHGGDFGAAASTLRKLGYGSPASSPRPELEEFVYEGVPVDGPAAPQWSRHTWDDLGNAERFAQRYQGRVLWVHDVGQWALYTDGCWHFRDQSLVGTLAQDLIRDLPELEMGLYDAEPGPPDKKGNPSPSEQEQFLTWLGKQRSDVRLRSMLNQARSCRELQGTRDMFDQDPMLLNCRNGVLDLRTGELLPHSPDMFLTQTAQVDWDPDAECPMWERYLEQTIPDREEREYLQRITGYSLTGDVSEQALFIHYGFGANGKSVYLEVVGNLLGSYSIGVQSSTLMARPYESSANEDVARMAGKRFLRTSETNVGRQLNEGQVKLLTGGDDVITARYLYQGSFDFRPTGKIHLATNHPPKVSNAESIWRRIQIIGWDVEIAAENRDRHLARKILQQERAGVLAWAMAGALQWQQQGLNPPASAELRTQQYRSDQDQLGDFVEECIQDKPGNLQEFPGLYASYQNWCEANGVRHPLSGKALSMALQERGFVRGRSNRVKGFKDVVVLSPLQAQIQGMQAPSWAPG